MKNLVWSAGLILAFIAATAEAAPTLIAASVSGKPGQVVVLPIKFDPASSSVSSLQYNLTLPKGVKPDEVKPGAILSSANKSVKTHVKGRTWTFLIFGINQTNIPAGDLLTAQLKIAPGAKAGSWEVPISGVVYTDPKGTVVKAGANTDGHVTVTAP